MLAIACIMGMVVSAVLLLAKAGSGIQNPGRVLLVTAHPDDETIFFAPVATSLHSRGLEVFLLCLTNGACAHRTSSYPCRDCPLVFILPSSLCISSLNGNPLSSTALYHTAARSWYTKCFVSPAGDAHGLGDLRQRELTEAAQQLQVRLSIHLRPSMHCPHKAFCFHSMF